MLEVKQNRIRRHRRVRAKIFGTKERPRFCVFRSNYHIYAQLIDDDQNKTLTTVSDLNLKSKKSIKSEKTKGEITRTRKAEIAYEVGKLIAQKASEKNIERIVFDRGGYRYHGIIKALAEGAREGGLKF